MTAAGRGWGPGLVAGLIFLLAGCATAYQQGQSALHEGRYLEATARFREALEDDPARADALLGLELAEYHLDAFPAAVGSLYHAETRLYLALTYLALDDQGAAARQLETLAGLDVHPRIATQAGRAVTLLRVGSLPAETRELVRKRLEDEGDWQRDLVEARLAPHVDLRPAWFVRDPAGWSPLGWYP